MKSLIKSREFIINMIVGGVLTIAVVIYSYVVYDQLLRALCDGFFVGGMALFGFGCLVYARNEGLFDGLTYGVSNLFATRNLAGEKQTMRYSEYKEQKKAKRKSSKGLLISGLFYTVISFIFLGIYMLQK